MSTELSATVTDVEQRFLHHVEVLGLKVARAAELTGVKNPYEVLKRPHVAAAREQIKLSLRQRLNITREDVVNGIKEAIDQAELLGDPTARIRGWVEISKLLGYDSAKKIEINYNGPEHMVRKQLEQMSDADLLKEAGMEDIIDAEWYDLDKS